MCYDGVEVDSLYISNTAEEVSLVYDVHTVYANYVEKHILSGKLSMKGYSGGLTGTEDFYGEVPAEWIRWLQRLEDRTRLLFDCDITVALKDEAGKRELGTLSEKSVWCDIMTDGTIRSSLEDPSIEEWKQQSAASERIPIDAEHFSEGSFRGCIEQHFDIDGIAGLPDKERESVLILDFSDSIRFYGGTLDGLEYFTGLTALYLGKTGSLIVENHPSLEIISENVAGIKALWEMNAGMEESFYDEIGLNRLWVKNCPSLKIINLDLSKIEDVVIENCETIDR